MRTALLFILSIVFFNTLNISTLKAQTNQINDDISSATSLVNQDSIESYIQHLENYGTRFMIAPNRLEIAKWLQNKFKSFGVDSVRIDTFETHTTYSGLGLDTTTSQYNVVAIIPGSSGKKIIICAHYDSFSSGDPFVFAPGADDDASGVAACLESARVFSEIVYTPTHTIEIIAFAAEELMNFGLGGYDIHAANAQANNDTIDLVIHNDMIGFNDGSLSVFFSTYPGCESETAMLAAICDDYTILHKKFWPPNMGPFADRAFYYRGYKCVYIEENFDLNPNYHQPTDLLANMNAFYCSEVIKISIGGAMQYDMPADTTTSINEIALIENNLFIFPNPVSNIATVNYTVERNSYIELALYDITGKKMEILEKGIKPKGQYRTQLVNKNYQGIYLISLSLDNKNIITQKVIINKH
ncbi:M20/M25/M40 family metallo-hydrolase [Bacteroidota bacterium]